MESSIPMISPAKRVYKVEQTFALKWYFTGFNKAYKEELNGLLNKEEYDQIIRRANKIVSRTLIYIASLFYGISAFIFFYMLFANPYSFQRHIGLLCAVILIPSVLILILSMRYFYTVPKQSQAFKQELNALYAHRNLKFSLKKSRKPVISYDLKIKHINPPLVVAQIPQFVQPQFIQQPMQQPQFQPYPYVQDYNIPLTQPQPQYIFTNQIQQPQQQPQFILTTPLPEPQYVQPPSNHQQYIPITQNEHTL
ncbi:hypothetical protein CYY_009264 [Polysphondylium violaceum]|uniref:Transmembrane protein n=1 Tax=Polysphondylium violaceum TaxID=133409 RepID=A0A8J4PKF8_9MYCE|nr:hypothetical protein CYY_009264 [Polysphondylium violaceum]